MTALDGNGHRTTWTTHDECTFVRQLYQWRGPEGVRLYIASFRLRHRWDGIDRKVAMETARRLLANGV